MWWPYTQKRREIQCHRREWRNHQNRNCGSTSICTTTTYLFFFPFSFLQLAQWGYPSGFERRCHGQQKGGGGGKQSSIWHIRKQQRVLFQQNAGFKGKIKVCGQTARLPREASKMRCVHFFFKGNDYTREKKKDGKSSYTRKRPPQCIWAQLREHSNRSCTILFCPLTRFPCKDSKREHHVFHRVRSFRYTKIIN